MNWRIDEMVFPLTTEDGDVFNAYDITVDDSPIVVIDADQDGHEKAAALITAAGNAAQQLEALDYNPARVFERLPLLIEFVFATNDRALAAPDGESALVLLADPTDASGRVDLRAEFLREVLTVAFGEPEANTDA